MFQEFVRRVGPQITKKTTNWRYTIISFFQGKATYPIINLNVRIVKHMSMINNFLLFFIFREPLDPGLKLAITLRHMATGATFRELMYSFRVADNTISKLIPTVLEAIVDTSKPRLCHHLLSQMNG